MGAALSADVDAPTERRYCARLVGGSSTRSAASVGDRARGEYYSPLLRADANQTVARLLSESVAISTELAVQLPVETRPVVDDGPGDEKYAADVCEDSRSRGWPLDLAE